MEKVNNYFKKFLKIEYLLYLCAFGIIITLYVRNAYFDIMDAKADLFLKMLRIAYPVVLLSSIIRTIIDRKSIRIDFFDASLLFLLCTSFISTICSFSLHDAMTGMQGWYVGFYAISFVIVSILLFKDRQLFIGRRLYLPLFAVVIFEYFLIFTDGMDLDLLGFKEKLYETQHFLFFGTIGNSNWVVGFLALTVPIFICSYILEKNRIYEIFYFLGSVFGIVASIINGADSIYVSYALTSFLFVSLIFENLDRLKRFSVLLIAVLCFLIIIRNNYHFSLFLSYLDNVGKIMFKPEYLTIALIFSITLFGVSISFKEKKYQKQRTKITVVIYILMILLLIVSLLQVLKTKNNIGSYRFQLWRYSFMAFKDYPFINKLIGFGPELVRNVYASFSMFLGVIYNASHSEPIQMLMTMGVFGFVSWFLCWISMFINFYKNKENALTQSLFTGIIAYFGQSFFNSATLLNVCVLSIVVIAMLKTQK